MKAHVSRSILGHAVKIAFLGILAFQLLLLSAALRVAFGQQSLIPVEYVVQLSPEQVVELLDQEPQAYSGGEIPDGYVQFGNQLWEEREIKVTNAAGESVWLKTSGVLASGKYLDSDKKLRQLSQPGAQAKESDTFVPFYRVIVYSGNIHFLGQDGVTSGTGQSNQGPGTTTGSTATTTTAAPTLPSNPGGAGAATSSGATTGSDLRATLNQILAGGGSQYVIPSGQAAPAPQIPSYQNPPAPGAVWQNGQWYLNGNPIGVSPAPGATFQNGQWVNPQGQIWQNGQWIAPTASTPAPQLPSGPQVNNPPVYNPGTTYNPGYNTGGNVIATRPGVTTGGAQPQVQAPAPGAVWQNGQWVTPAPRQSTTTTTTAVPSAPTISYPQGSGATTATGPGFVTTGVPAAHSVPTGASASGVITTPGAPGSQTSASLALQQMLGQAAAGQGGQINWNVQGQVNAPASQQARQQQQQQAPYPGAVFQNGQWVIPQSQAQGAQPPVQGAVMQNGQWVLPSGQASGNISAPSVQVPSAQSTTATGAGQYQLPNGAISPGSAVQGDLAQVWNQFAGVPFVTGSGPLVPVNDASYKLQYLNWWVSNLGYDVLNRDEATARANDQKGFIHNGFLKKFEKNDPKYALDLNGDFIYTTKVEILGKASNNDEWVLTRRIQFQDGSVQYRLLTQPEHELAVAYAQARVNLADSVINNPSANEQQKAQYKAEKEKYLKWLKQAAKVDIAKKDGSNYVASYDADAYSKVREHAWNKNYSFAVGAGQQIQYRFDNGGIIANGQQVNGVVHTTQVQGGAQSQYIPSGSPSTVSTGQATYSPPVATVQQSAPGSTGYSTSGVYVQGPAVTTGSAPINIAIGQDQSVNSQQAALLQQITQAYLSSIGQTTAFTPANYAGLNAWLAQIAANPSSNQQVYQWIVQLNQATNPNQQATSAPSAPATTTPSQASAPSSGAAVSSGRVARSDADLQYFRQEMFGSNRVKQTVYRVGPDGIEYGFVTTVIKLEDALFDENGELVAQGPIGLLQAENPDAPTPQSAPATQESEATSDTDELREQLRALLGQIEFEQTDGVYIEAEDGSHHPVVGEFYNLETGTEQRVSAELLIRQMNAVGVGVKISGDHPAVKGLDSKAPLYNARNPG